MKARHILFLLLAATFGPRAFGQIDFLSQALDATNAQYLDVQRDLGTIHAATEELTQNSQVTAIVPLTWQAFLGNAPGAPCATSLKEAPSTPGTTWGQRFSMQYGYVRNNSKLSDDATTNANSVTPTYFFVSPDKGFTLQTGFTYAYSSKRTDAPSGTGTDAYTVIIQPSEELLRFFPALKHSKYDTLSLAVAFAYGRSISGTTARTGHTGTTIDGYTVGPNITYVRKFSNSFSTTLQPQYQLVWKSSDPDAGTAHTQTNNGIFKLSGKADYSICAHLIISATGAWSHDTTQRVAVGQVATYRDWASVGAALEYDFTTTFKAKASYSYDAFRNDYAQHNVQASLEMAF